MLIGCKYCPLPGGRSLHDEKSRVARYASITSLLPQESANQSVRIIYIYNINNVTRAQSFSAYSMPPRCNFRPRGSLPTRSFTIFPRDRDRMHRVVCTCLTLPPARNYTAPPLFYNPREEGKEGSERKRERGRNIPQGSRCFSRLVLGPLPVNRVVFKHIRVTLHIYWRFVAA